MDIVRIKRGQDVQCGGHAFSFSTGEAEAASQHGEYGKTQASQGDKVRPRALLPKKDEYCLMISNEGGLLASTLTQEPTHKGCLSRMI